MAEDVDTLFPADQGRDVDTLFPPDVERTRQSGVTHSPVADLIFGDADHNPAARILNAFGQGVRQGWGSDRIGMSDETSDYLKKAGVFNDYQTGQTSVIKAANEALMRQAAVVLNLNLKTLPALTGGLTKAIGVVSPWAGEHLETAIQIANDPATQAALGPQLGPAGALLSAAARVGALSLPHLQPLAEAKSLGVIGEGEAGWKGTAPTKSDAAMAADAEAVKQTVEATQPVPGQAEEATPAAATEAPQAALPTVPSPKIVADVSQKLVAAGRPQEEADAAAQIVSAYWQTRAERFKGAKGTAEDMYAAEGPEIKAGKVQDRVLAQKGETDLGQTYEQAPTYYSAAARFIDDSKQEKASPDQWRGMLKNAAGVKPEEVEWLGLDDWLKEQKGQVTKQQITDYIRSNAIEVKEVEKGAKDIPAELKKIDARIEAIQDEFDALHQQPDSAEIAQRRTELVGERADLYHQSKQLQTNERTKFGTGMGAPLPGGENYRELLLTLPEKPGERGPKGWGDTGGGTSDTTNFRSSHWDEPNVLAHIRFDDRVTDGKKTLHLAEIQSDWHQAGRKRGYQSTEPHVAAYYEPTAGNKVTIGHGQTEAEALADAKDWHEILKDRFPIQFEHSTRTKTAGVPDAPFKTTWPELSLKRMIRYAAENGYERLSWDTGDTNAARYDLSKHIDRIEYEPIHDPADTFEVVAYDKNDRRIFSEDEIPLTRVEEVLGKEIADKIAAGHGEQKGEPGSGYRNWKTLAGLDLKVGGEGMRGFYDKILPTAANKLVKKFGAKVGQTTVGSDVTVEKIQTTHGFEWEVSDPNNPDEVLSRTTDEGAARRFAERHKSAQAHTIDITPQLKDAAINQGFALFQEAKGRIRLRDNGQSTITLLKNADASTFIHETGHEWLDRMLRDADDAQAPPDLKADADTVLKWLEADSADAVKTKQHEKFARGFETYIMEGRAPSTALATVFAKFKDWLTTIYRTVSALKSPISDDIRSVFDRLLATNPEQPYGELHRALGKVAPEESAVDVAGQIRAERTRTGTPVSPDAGGAAVGANPADEAGRAGLAEGHREPERNVDAGGNPPAAEGAGVPQEVVEPVKGPAAQPEKQRSLLSYLASRGGIRNDDGNIGDLRNSIGAKNKFIPGFGQLIREPKQLSTAAVKSGRGAAMSLDTAREAAIEAGYLPEDTTLPQFLDALDRELRGERIYPHGYTPEGRPVDPAELEYAQHSFLESLNDLVAGGKPLTDKERARALELWRHEGLNDPAAILERLFLEADDAETAEGAPAREESVPGWDVPDDTGPTQDAGAAIAPGESEQPGGGISRVGGEGAREEPPVTAHDPLPRSETKLLDKAGNIRLDNLGTPQDVNAVIRQVADENEGFIGARRQVSDKQVLDLADALGVTDVEKLLKNRKIGEAFNAESIMAARKLLVQSASAVKDAMAKAASGTDADVVAYAEARARHLMIQEQVSGITAEAGRALRAFRNLGGEHIKEAQQVTDFLRAATGKTLYQLRQEAQLGLSLETTQQISKYILDSAKPTFGDMILEYWINGLISGPATHTTYSVGNALLALNKAGPETAAAALSSKVFEALGREGSGITVGEVPSRLYGLLKGTRDGIVAAYEAGKTGQTHMLPGELEGMTARDIGQSPLVNPRAAIPNFTVGGVPVPVGTFARLPSRAVAMIHSFFRSVNYASEMAGLAHRQAVIEGVEGEAFARRIGEITTDPSVELMAQARSSATDLTLMGRGGELTQVLSRLTNAKFLGFQWLKFIDPFVHISSNVIEQAILQRTPVGVLAPEIRANIMGRNGPAARDMAIGRMAVGSAIGVGVGSLAAEGLVNGSGPSDPKELAIWTMVNGPPHSVRIGDTWFDIHRLGPLGMLVGITADLYQLWHKIGEEDAAHVAHSISHAFTQNILDESFMRGPADLIKALTDPDRYGASWVRNFLASFTPYSVGLSQVARAIDPYSRNAKTTLDAVRAKMPWLSETLLPRRDVFGEPIPNKSALGIPGLSAIYEQKVNRDPVPKALLEASIFPAMPAKKIRGVELTPQQYDDFARVAGRMAKMRLNAVVAIPGFNQMPQAVKTELLHKAIEGAHETARDLILMQNQSIVNQAKDNKVAKLRGEKPTVH